MRTTILSGFPVEATLENGCLVLRSVETGKPYGDWLYVRLTAGQRLDLEHEIAAAEAFAASNHYVEWDR